MKVHATGNQALFLNHKNEKILHMNERSLNNFKITWMFQMQCGGKLVDFVSG